MSDTREQIAKTLERCLKDHPCLRAGQLVQNAVDQAAERAAKGVGAMSNGTQNQRAIRKGTRVALSAKGRRKWPHGKWFIFVVESNRRGTVHMRRDGFDWFCTPADVVRWRRACPHTVRAVPANWETQADALVTRLQLADLAAGREPVEAATIREVLRRRAEMAAAEVRAGRVAVASKEEEP